MKRQKVLFIGFFIVMSACAARIVSLQFKFQDFDEGVYIATIRSMLHGAPLYEVTYLSQFPLFLDISSFLYQIVQNIILLRLEVVVCSLLIIILSYIICYRYAGLKAAVFCSLYLSFNGMFLLVSRTFQLDIPWVAFTLITFFFLLKFDETRRILFLIAGSLAFTASVLIKANPTFIFVLAGYVFFLFRDLKFKAFWYVSIFIAVGCIATFTVIPIHDLQLIYKETIGIRSAHTAFSLSTILHGPRKTLLQDEWPVLFLDIGSFLFLCYRKPENKAAFRCYTLLLIWLAGTGLVFIFYNQLFNHHLVFFILPEVLFASLYIEECYRQIQNSYFTTCIFTGLLLVILLRTSGTGPVTDPGIWFPKVSAYDANLSAASSYITKTTVASDYIITDDPFLGYLADRNTTPQTVDTSTVRIEAGSLTAQSLIESTEKYKVREVVFISGRFSKLPQYTTYLMQAYTEKIYPGFIIFIRK